MKEKSLVKLMIATMIVDSHRDEREYVAIADSLEHHGVTEEEYSDLLNESKEINDSVEVMAWSQTAIEALQELNDPEFSCVVIANMVLVACADNVVKDVEEAFIQTTATSLGVDGPVRR